MGKSGDGPRTCEVSGNGCIAPAGYGISGLGTCEGTKSCRGTCFGCGNPVCRKCSNVREWHNHGRQRICHNCYDPEEVKRETADKKSRTALTLTCNESGLQTLWERVQARDTEVAATFRRFKVVQFGAWEIDDKGFLKK